MSSINIYILLHTVYGQLYINLLCSCSLNPEYNAQPCVAGDGEHQRTDPVLRPHGEGGQRDQEAGRQEGLHNPPGSG